MLPPAPRQRYQLKPTGLLETRAVHYWPARVRENCKTDKSLAIAHDLEALYVEPEAKPIKQRGKKTGA
jgi:hypothetical protein